MLEWFLFPRVALRQFNRRSDEHPRMSFTVFLGNLPVWVTADDVQSWLTSESLVADSIKVIRHPETQESKGFAFIEAPNAEEMQSIIRRFDRAPLEDRLLRANPAQPPRPKGQMAPPGPSSTGRPLQRAPRYGSPGTARTSPSLRLARSPRNWLRLSEVRPFRSSGPFLNETRVRFL